MAFTQLKTDYVNDALNTSVNQNIKYILTENDDDTISLQDATSYSVMGDQLDASVINGIDEVVNAIGDQVTVNVGDIAKLLAGKIDIDTSAQSGTVDGNLYDAITALSWQSNVIE